MNNQPINLISMDYQEIKESLKTFLKSQDEFSDYNFEGSGLNVFLNTLAYDAQSTAYLANMLANESNIDTAILRENVVSRAKLLGYTPKSNSASKAVIHIRVNDPTNESFSLLLPRGTKFTANSGSKLYTFITLIDYNLHLNPESSLYENSEIEIYEGTIKGASWEVKADTRFVIQSSKIDTNTLKIGVFPSYATSDGIIYERAYNLEKIKNNSRAFWVQETDGQRFEIKFGDGIFGQKPVINNVVYAEYLETNSVDANSLSRFSLSGSFSSVNSSNITISTINASSGGSVHESTSAIKINAPRSFSSQGRCTTTDDYKDAVTEIYPYTKSVSVWGGDEETPKKYGKVFISIIPQDGTLITSFTKGELARKLKSRSVIGIQPVVIDPDFIYMTMFANVNVKRNSIAQLKDFSTNLRTLIFEFFDTNMYQFNENFYYSNLTTTIENFSKSITSVKVNYELSIKGVVSKTDFKFQNEIDSGSIRSSFVSTERNSELRSLTDKNGVVYHGSEIIGNVDYLTGIMNINSILYSNTGDIEVFVTPSNKDVIAQHNTAIQLSKERLTVELRSI